MTVSNVSIAIAMKVVGMNEINVRIVKEVKMMIVVGLAVIAGRQPTVEYIVKKDQDQALVIVVSLNSISRANSFRLSVQLKYHSKLRERVIK